MLCSLYSAWIAEDQIWPYAEFKSKYVITQKVPQGFREAVDAIEEQIHAGGDTTSSTLVIRSIDLLPPLRRMYFCRCLSVC